MEPVSAVGQVEELEYFPVVLTPFCDMKILINYDVTINLNLDVNRTNDRALITNIENKCSVVVR